MVPLDLHNSAFGSKIIEFRGKKVSVNLLLIIAKNPFVKFLCHMKIKINKLLIGTA